MPPRRPDTLDKALETLYREFKVDQEIELSSQNIGDLLNLPRYSIVRILSALNKAGAAKLRYFTRPGETQGPWRKGFGGRHSAWTLLVDYETAKLIVEASRGDKVDTRPSPSKRKAVDYLADKISEPRPKVIGKDFSVLAPLKRDESRAFLEVARKFRDQQSFIAAERLRFKEMGLEMGDVRSAYDPEQTTDLQAVVKVLPYVEGLENENGRLAQQYKLVRQPEAELSRIRDELRQTKEYNQRLISEKGSLQDSAKELDSLHLGKLQARDRKINELEEANRQLRQQLAVKRIDAAVEKVNNTEEQKGATPA